MSVDTTPISTMLELSGSVSIGYYSSGDQTTLVQTVAEIGVELAKNLRYTDVVIIDTDPTATLTLQWFKNGIETCLEMQNQDPTQPLMNSSFGKKYNLYNVLGSTLYAKHYHYDLLTRFGGQLLHKYNDNDDNLSILFGSTQLMSLEYQFMCGMCNPTIMPALVGTTKLFKSLLDSIKKHYEKLNRQVVILVPICSYGSYLSRNFGISCDFIQVLVGKYDSNITSAGNFLRMLHTDNERFGESHSRSTVIGIDISALSCEISSNETFQKSIFRRLLFDVHPNIHPDDSWAKLTFDNLVSHCLFPNFGKGGIPTVTSNINSTNTVDSNDCGDSANLDTFNHQYTDSIDSLLMIANFNSTNLSNVNPHTISDESVALLNCKHLKHLLNRYIYCLISRIPSITNTHFPSGCQYCR